MVASSKLYVQAGLELGLELTSPGFPGEPIFTFLLLEMRSGPVADQRETWSATPALSGLILQVQHLPLDSCAVMLASSIGPNVPQMKDGVARNRRFKFLVKFLLFISCTQMFLLAFGTSLPAPCPTVREDMMAYKRRPNGSLRNATNLTFPCNNM